MAKNGAGRGRGRGRGVLRGHIHIAQGRAPVRGRDPGRGHRRFLEGGLGHRLIWKGGELPARGRSPSPTRGRPVSSPRITTKVPAKMMMKVAFIRIVQEAIIPMRMNTMMRGIKRGVLGPGVGVDLLVLKLFYLVVINLILVIPF